MRRARAAWAGSLPTAASSRDPVHTRIIFVGRFVLAADYSMRRMAILGIPTLGRERHEKQHSARALRAYEPHLNGLWPFMAALTIAGRHQRPISYPYYSIPSHVWTSYRRRNILIDFRTTTGPFIFPDVDLFPQQIPAAEEKDSSPVGPLVDIQLTILFMISHFAFPLLHL